VTFSDIHMPTPLQDKLRSLAPTHEVLTTRQLLEAGISDQSITRLVGQGVLTAGATLSAQRTTTWTTLPALGRCPKRSWQISAVRPQGMT